MKGMKQLLIVLGLISTLTLSAQRMVEYPVVQMHSTSTMIGSGSTLPSAAHTGYISADDNLAMHSPRGPQRAAADDDEAPEDPNGPMEDPIGDIPWGIFFIAVAVYTLRIYFKTTRKELTRK